MYIDRSSQLLHLLANVQMNTDVHNALVSSLGKGQEKQARR